MEQARYCHGLMASSTDPSCGHLHVRPLAAVNRPYVLLEGMLRISMSSYYLCSDLTSVLLGE